jgi:hypothetical protein
VGKRVVGKSFDVPSQWTGVRDGLRWLLKRLAEILHRDRFKSNLSHLNLNYYGRFAQMWHYFLLEIQLLQPFGGPFLLSQK